MSDSRSTPDKRAGAPDAGAPSRSRQVNPRRRGAPRKLSQTRGPDPATPIADVRLVVGTIGGPHGVRGELKLHLLTDHPEHLATIRTVYLGNSDSPVTLENIRFTNDGALIKLAGTDTPEDGRKLGGLAVRIAGADAKPLEPGEYFLFQLIGLTVVDESGKTIGEVTDLMETGAHDVLVIQPAAGGDDILVPNHPEYVVATDPEAGRMTVRLPIYQN